MQVGNSAFGRARPSSGLPTPTSTGARQSSAGPAPTYPSAQRAVQASDLSRAWRTPADLLLQDDYAIGGSRRVGVAEVAEAWLPRALVTPVTASRPAPFF